MLARFTVTPEGLIIGCVVPNVLPNNNIQLKENMVYELHADMIYSELITLTTLGDSVYPMSECSGSKDRGCSLDKYIALAQGRHLLIEGEK